MSDDKEKPSPKENDAGPVSYEGWYDEDGKFHYQDIPSGREWIEMTEEEMDDPHGHGITEFIMEMNAPKREPLWNPPEPKYPPRPPTEPGKHVEWQGTNPVVKKDNE